jgi:hypothetical protein
MDREQTQNGLCPDDYNANKNKKVVNSTITLSSFSDINNLK